MSALRDALDSYPVGDPMRAAIQVGIDEPKIPSTDTRPRDCNNRLVAIKVNMTVNKGVLHDPYRGPEQYNDDSPAIYPIRPLQRG